MRYVKNTILERNEKPFVMNVAEFGTSVLIRHKFNHRLKISPAYWEAMSSFGYK